MNETVVAAPARPTFVVGTGRCGSTLLSQMINLHPRILSISEWFTVLGEHRALDEVRVDARTFLQLLGIPTQDNRELLRRFPNLPELRLPPRLPQVDSPEELAPVLTTPLPSLASDPCDVLRELHELFLTDQVQTLSAWHSAAFAFLTQRQHKKIWIERSGGSLAYVNSLQRAWPGARYIHLYRNGVDCALSMSRHPYFRVRVARALARTQVAVGDCLEMTIAIEHFGAYWSAIVSTGLRVLRRLPERDVLHIDYAELVQRPTQVLRRVQRFLEGHVQADEWVAQAATLARSAVVRTGSESMVTKRLERACRLGMCELRSLRAESVDQYDPSHR